MLLNRVLFDEEKKNTAKVGEDGLVFKQARHENIQSQAINVLQCKTPGLCACGKLKGNTGKELPNSDRLKYEKAK